MRNILLIIVLLAFCTQAQDFIPVQHESILSAYKYKPEWYSFVRKEVFANGFRGYTMSAMRWHATPEREAYTDFKIEGSQGFSGLCDFLVIKVNGILQKKVLLDNSKFTPWQEGGNKGFQLSLNFNGAKLCIRYYMRPDSPVLWGRILPDKSSLEPIRNMEMVFTALPSKYVKNEKNRVVWGKVYGRCIDTRKRVIAQGAGYTILGKDEKHIVMMDTIFDGSAPDKGKGPCMLVLDHADFEKVTVRPVNNWLTSVRTVPEKNFTDIDFGIYNHPVAISNEDFLKYLDEHPGAFSIDQ